MSSIMAARMARVTGCCTHPLLAAREGHHRTSSSPPAREERRSTGRHSATAFVRKTSVHSSVASSRGAARRTTRPSRAATSSLRRGQSRSSGTHNHVSGPCPENGLLEGKRRGVVRVREADALEDAVAFAGRDDLARGRDDDDVVREALEEAAVVPGRREDDLVAVGRLAPLERPALAAPRGVLDARTRRARAVVERDARRKRAGTDDAAHETGRRRREGRDDDVVGAAVLWRCGRPPRGGGVFGGPQRDRHDGLVVALWRSCADRRGDRPDRGADAVAQARVGQPEDLARAALEPIEVFREPDHVASPARRAHHRVRRATGRRTRRLEPRARRRVRRRQDGGGVLGPRDGAPRSDDRRGVFQWSRRRWVLFPPRVRWSSSSSPRSTGVSAGPPRCGSSSPVAVEAHGAPGHEGRPDGDHVVVSDE
mmetsp:Transcript_8200/g.33751  ORF Transcript_8200/g.33751 Transcript_8200/m.33751 type:complete len:426 (+) Transcript_8200:186-1463(+)